MSTKKILFMTGHKVYADTFWNQDCIETSRKLDFSVDVPALQHDCLDTDWKKLLPDYDAVITTWSSPCCNAKLLSNCPKIKIIGHAAGSVAMIVDQSTFDAGIRVTTANYIMAEAVAEWSLLSTLMAVRNVLAYTQWGNQNSMNWKRAFDMRDLKRSTIGIWGMGDTTRHLLNMLAPLHPGRIIVCSNHSSASSLAEFGAEKCSLEEVFAESDIIHLLAGVNHENLFRIGEKELRLIKPGATLINGGRARLVQEQPLLQELQTERFNAIFDVFYQEPLPEDSPFKQLKNVIYTPHNAGFTGRERFVPFILNEFARMFRGEPLLGEINRQRHLTMTDERLGR